MHDPGLMLVYRIEKEKYLPTIFEGQAGKDHNFRWNTKGHPIIYASESKSLALHEKGGNLSRPSYGIPADYLVAIIEIPDRDYERVAINKLPKGWDDFAEYHPTSQQIGDKFTRSKALALFVPSTMVKGEYNVLLNPNVIKKHKVKLITELIDHRLTDIRK